MESLCCFVEYPRQHMEKRYTGATHQPPRTEGIEMEIILAHAYDDNGYRCTLAAFSNLADAEKFQEVFDEYPEHVRKGEYCVLHTGLQLDAKVMVSAR